MIVAIHQPNFFPWLGYFKKIAQSDVFVFLDSVPLSRGSRGTWVNRVRLLVNRFPRWTTCPIKRASSQMNISDVIIDSSLPWRNKLIKTVELNYAKATHFSHTMPWLVPLIETQGSILSDYNIGNIMAIAGQMGLKCRFERQSHLKNPAVFQTQGSKRLAAICQELEASAYLAGDGAAGYEDESVYDSAGIKLIHSRFIQPSYPQIGSTEFVAGLSVIDCLLNAGLERTAHLLRNND